MPLTKQSQNRRFKQHNGFFSPLLPYVLTAIAAFSCAARFDTLRAFGNLTLLCGASLLLLQITLNFLFKDEKSECDGVLQKDTRNYYLIKNIFAFFGVFSICIWYFFERLPQNPYPDYTPRTVELDLRLDETSRSANGSIYGIATIARADANLGKLAGQRVWYSFESGDGGRSQTFLPTQTVRIKSVLFDVSGQALRSRGNLDGKSGGFEKYLRERMIFFKLRADSNDVKIISQASRAAKFFAAANAYMRRSLSASLAPLNPEWRNTYIAMILGDKSLLTREQKDTFAETGTMHVFAISGLHVGFVAFLGYLILRLFKVNWRVQPLLVLPILFLYVAACGARPSAMRAFGMIAIIWCAMSLMRGVRPFAALVLSAAVALLFSPWNIFDAGFCLSYAIVASIFLYGLPLYMVFSRMAFGNIRVEDMSLKERFVHRIFSFSVGGLCISIGAFFASSPMSAHYFSYIAPMSILYSPFFVTAAGFAVGLGFLGFAFPNGISAAFNFFAVLIVGAMDESATAGAKLFDSSVEISLNSAGAMASVLATFLIGALLSANARPYFRFLIPPALASALMAVLVILNK